jgi:hypothetical protein
VRGVAFSGLVHVFVSRHFEGIIQTRFGGCAADHFSLFLSSSLFQGRVRSFENSSSGGQISRFDTALIKATIAVP